MYDRFAKRTTTRILLVLSAVATLSASVSGCGGGGAGGSAPGGSGGATACSAPASRALSQPCCPEHGADACGAGLFCAAFDGRTQPTCYPERSRPDGAECAASIQCTSGACNADRRRCQSLPGQACTQEVGCAPDPTGRAYVCNPVAELGFPANSCAPTDPMNGGLCIGDDGCASHLCVNGRCSSGESGSPCHDAGDCAPSAPLCVDERCSPGTAGTACASPAECASTAPFCVKGACRTGDAGSPCGSGAECAPFAPHCVGSACHAGTYGDPCASKADCAAEYPVCLDGQCHSLVSLGGTCAHSSECKPLGASSHHRSSAVLCDMGHCRVAPGEPCDLSNDLCAAGYSCQPAPGGECLDGSNAPCSGELCCGANDKCNWVCFNGTSCQP